MNANELADRLENDDRLWFVNEDLMVKTCAMLRQQQAEIEALKTYKSNQTLECSFDLAGFKPLAKTLTDEEIEEVFRTVEQDFALTESKKSDGGWRNFPVELGRAILRKAQEK